MDFENTLKMYQNFIVVLIALSYFETSNAAHSASLKYIGSVDSLVNNDWSAEKIMLSIQQLEPNFYSKTYTFVDVNLPRAQQYEDPLIFESFRKVAILLKFFQLLSNPGTVAANRPILEATSKRIFNYKAGSKPQTDQQRIKIALTRLDEVGEQTIKEFQKYLTSVLDSLAKNPSNLVFKSLVKTDLLLTFYQRTKGTKSRPSPSQTSNENDKLAADLPKILNALAMEYKILSEFDEALADQ